MWKDMCKHLRPPTIVPNLFAGLRASQVRVSMYSIHHAHVGDGTLYGDIAGTR